MVYSHTSSSVMEQLENSFIHLGDLLFAASSYANTDSATAKA